MNETIGVKGGKNDRRRSMKIKARRKKILEEIQKQNEIKTLEKEVKKNQKFVFIKTVPIVLVGASVRNLIKPAIKEEEKKEIKLVPVHGKNKNVKIFKPLREIATKKDEDKSKELNIEVKVYSPKKEEKEKQVEVSKRDNQYQEINAPQAKGIGKKKEEKETVVPFRPVGVALDEVEAQLDEKGRETYQKLKAHKIVDVYYEKLKEIRYELRNLVYEYNVLVDEEEKAITSKEAEVVLDKLSDVIRRLEILKNKLKVDNIDKYDDNYIYTLIEEYLKEFQDGKIVSSMKDSPLYIMVSEKLAELDEKKNSFQKEVKAKKGALQKKEADFDKLKERYNKVHRIDEELLRFQYNQDALLKEMEEKVRNAQSVSERVEVRVEGLNRQSRRLLALLSLAMLIPGAKSAKRVAASTAAYIYFMRNVVNPRTTTIRHRVITVKDYSSGISDSIAAINSSMGLLGKTEKEIDKMISLVRHEFGDYIGVLSECDELLQNLNKVKENIKEKEYEMAKIKKEQEKLLEQNNAKVLTMGEYPM